MKASLILALLILFRLLAPPGTGAGPSTAAFEFGPEGLRSVRSQGVELLKKGTPYVEFFMAQEGGEIKATSPGQPAASFDAASMTETVAYPWGSVACRYLPAKDRLGIEVTMTNRSTQPIFHVSLNLLELHLPSAPVGRGWDQSHVQCSSSDGVAAVLADYGSGAVSVTGESFAEDYTVGFFKLSGQAASDLGVNLSTLSQRASDTYHQDFPLPAGATKKIEVSLRFGPAGSTLGGTTGDLYRRFGKAFPRKLDWPDRRPIAEVLLSSPAAQHHSPQNPRGWLNDPKLDAMGLHDRGAFRQRMLRWADDCVKNLKAMNAQGMILWDVEGEQMPHPTTFIGDPREAPKFAPEMDAIADELFAKFRKAELRTGVCIRPSRIRPNLDKSAPIPVVHDNMAFDPVEEMSAKIDYAKKRWGCTLFYVDSNVTWAFAAGTDPSAHKVISWPMRADMFRRLAVKHPDALIIPELPLLGYYSHTATYRELQGGITSTPGEALLAYPGAFSVIKVEDEKLVEAHRAELVAGVRRGDILLFPGWYNPPVNGKVRQIYQQAQERKEEGRSKK